MLTRLDDLLRRGDPDRPAVTHKDVTLTYRELTDRVGRAAAGLLRLGLRRGERVVVYLEKRIETVVALLAVSRAGGVVVPVNPVFKPPQVAHVVADCAPTIMITSERRHRVLKAGLGPDSPRVVLVDEWHSLCDTESAPEPEVIDADLAAILYTSGSTGGPKGVVLTHRNLLAGAESVAAYLGHTAEDVVLSVLPLSFDAGLSQLTTSFVAGAHVVLVNYLLPREVIRECARHRVTALTGVPPLWLQLIAHRWPAEATASLRYFANTGGRLPKTTVDRLRGIFPQAEPFLMYGLTEAFRSTYLDPAEIDRRPDSIGKAIPNAEILVLRPDGSPCGPGEHGEIVHRGALVAQGYWNDRECTEERFRPYPPGRADSPERAVWSGDVGYRDEDGFLYFVGRTDEMIKTSGYRVSPTEIEEAAYATGLIDEAVAFGVPCEQLGQRIVLAVTGFGACPADADTLRKALENELPGYLVPRRLVLCSELPRSPNGKFDRAALRRQVAE